VARGDDAGSELSARAARLHDELRTVGPPPPTRGGAVRAGLSLLVPLTVLAATGRLDLGLYATFGALTGVHGGAIAYRGRWRMQAACGAVLALSVLVGSLFAVEVPAVTERWAVVALAAVWAALAAAGSDRWGWLPPGPMFPVFAIASCASVPLPADHLPLVALTVLGAAAGAFALALAEELVVPRLREAPERPPARPRQSPARERIHLVRCAVAVAAAGALMTAVGADHPYWAMVSAVVPFARPGLRFQVARGIHRVVGTLLGLGLAAPLLWADLPPVAVVLLLAALQVGIELVITRHYGWAMLLITPLALLAIQLAHPTPIGPLLASRFVETLVGAAVGMLTAWLTRQRR
jgi:hypothetical protein